MNSVLKTHRAVIVEEDWPYCGLGAGISDRITQAAFDELDAPIRRVAAKDAPIPYNRILEASMLPSVDRIIAAVHDVMYR
jgi:pyruvate dehydrogenase E1 component beta subunit